MVWAEDDAYHRRRKLQQGNAVIVWFGILWIGLALRASCDREVSQPTIPPAIPPAIQPAATPAPGAADLPCETDQDCVLRPSFITCCGVCDPAPPFQAVSRKRLDVLLWQTDALCTPRTRPCAPVSCSTRPATCEAGAVCHAGECRVIQSAECATC